MCIIVKRMLSLFTGLVTNQLLTKIIQIILQLLSSVQETRVLELVYDIAHFNLFRIISKFSIGDTAQLSFLTICAIATRLRVDVFFLNRRLSRTNILDRANYVKYKLLLNREIDIFSTRYFVGKFTLSLMIIIIQLRNDTIYFIVCHRDLV